MNTNYYDDARISTPSNSGGKIAYDRRPQLRIPNQQSSSNLGFKKPRIPLSVNRFKNSVPYKSELCILFQQRRCYYGENCHYAHNLSEIRQPGLKPVAMGEHVGERNAMWRRQECRYFSSGRGCPYGDNCQFLHKCDQNVGRNDTGLNRVSDRIVCRSLSGAQHYEKSIFHKTRLCLEWEQRFGSCRLGEKCTYAHGREELREAGYYAELKKSHDSRLMPDSQLSFAGSCMGGIKDAMKEGRVPIMDWNIAKISEIYADWVGVGCDLSMFC